MVLDHTQQVAVERGQLRGPMPVDGDGGLARIEVEGELQEESAHRLKLITWNEPSPSAKWTET